MNKIKYKSIVISSFIVLAIIGCLVSINLVIKSFNEWNRSLDSYKPEIISKYGGNKKEFSDIVSYVQGMDSEVYIERGNGTNYKASKYGGGVVNYNIEDKILDKSIRQIFKDSFINIDKDRGGVYFVYRSGLGGAQGIVYTDDLQKLVRYKNMKTEQIEDRWYYFLGD